MPRDNGRKPWKTEWILELLTAPLPPNVILILVGNGRGRQRVEENISKLKIEERVRLAGLVPHDMYGGSMQCVTFTLILL